MSWVSFDHRQSFDRQKNDGVHSIGAAFGALRRLIDDDDTSCCFQTCLSCADEWPTRAAATADWLP